MRQKTIMSNKQEQMKVYKQYINYKSDVKMIKIQGIIQGDQQTNKKNEIKIYKAEFKKIVQQFQKYNFIYQIIQIYIYTHTQIYNLTKFAISFLQPQSLHSIILNIPKYDLNNIFNCYSQYNIFMPEQIYQYLQLVKTYQLGKWLHTSAKLTPYVLASRGFRCIQSNKIQCHMCLVQVSFQKMRLGQQNLEEQAYILDEIKQHKKQCLYSKQNMDDEQLYRINRSELYGNMDKLYEKMRQTFKFYKSKYVWISQQFWNKYLLKYESVFKKFNDKFSEDKQILLSQFLPIFGWQIFQDAQSTQKPKMICQFCGRIIQINKFLHHNQQKQKISATISIKNNQRIFHPIQQHRYFCIWGNYDQEAILNEQNIYGWQICLKHFQDKMIQVEKGWGRRQKFEQVAKVKQQFNKILENFSNKTKDIMSKFNNSFKQFQPIFIQGQDKQKYDKTIYRSKQNIEQTMKEIEDIIKVPMKKVKLV